MREAPAASAADDVAEQPADMDEGEGGEDENEFLDRLLGDLGQSGVPQFPTEARNTSPIFGFF